MSEKAPKLNPQWAEFALRYMDRVPLEGREASEFLQTRNVLVAVVQGDLEVYPKAKEEPPPPPPPPPIREP